MNTLTLECGHTIPAPAGTGGTGYGVDKDGKRKCYACCADSDRADMIEHGDATLYLIGRDIPLEGSAPGGFARDGKRWYIGNWPGSLQFPVSFMKSSRRGGGFGSQRTDAWFTGPDGKTVARNQSRRYGNCKVSPHQTIGRLQRIARQRYLMRFRASSAPTLPLSKGFHHDTRTSKNAAEDR